MDRVTLPSEGVFQFQSSSSICATTARLFVAAIPYALSVCACAGIGFAEPVLAAPAAGHSPAAEERKIPPQLTASGVVAAPVAPPDVSGLQDPMNALQFVFASIAQYADCLEDILQLYQGPVAFKAQPRHSMCLPEVFEAYKDTGFSRQQALQLVQAADFYATKLLSSTLYPPFGQRERVARWFGFVYGMDMTNPKMQALATQAK